MVGSCNPPLKPTRIDFSTSQIGAAFCGYYEFKHSPVLRGVKDSGMNSYGQGQKWPSKMAIRSVIQKIKGSQRAWKISNEIKKKNEA